jgi:flavin reductase (DIM6/NTAB) family NADH-FMN oxidoreductase RutF
MGPTAWLKSRLRALRRPRHGAPTPEFMRVAYSVPRQVVLITARHAGAENVWPMDWHLPLSLDPPLYGLAVNRSGYGAELVRASGAFVVNFVPATWGHAIDICGRASGRQVDKFAAAALVKEEAQLVDASRLAEALGFLECRVVRIVEVGDHTLFVGRVVHEVSRASAPRLHHLHRDLADQAERFE